MTEPDGETDAAPGFGSLEPRADQPAIAPAPSSTPTEALGQRIIAPGWIAAGGGLLALLLGAWLLWRRRKPRVLRLAPPPPEIEGDDTPVLPRIDLSLDISGATRSVMTLTLNYRLTLANRSDRAVSDLAVAVQLTSARHGSDNAAPLASARNLAGIERIGPNQSRSVSGEVQLPFSAIAPIMQGRTALFIPLMHVTIEGQEQQVLTRSFVIGPPSGAEGRVHPLPFDLPPGSVPGLKARAIATPQGT